MGISSLFRHRREVSRCPYSAILARSETLSPSGLVAVTRTLVATRRRASIRRRFFPLVKIAPEESRSSQREQTSPRPVAMLTYSPPKGQLDRTDDGSAR